MVYYNDSCLRVDSYGIHVSYFLIVASCFFVGMFAAWYWLSGEIDHN